MAKDEATTSVTNLARRTQAPVRASILRNSVPPQVSDSMKRFFVVTRKAPGRAMLTSFLALVVFPGSRLPINPNQVSATLGRETRSRRKCASAARHGAKGDSHVFSD